jgi:hypothetical protein
MTTTVQLDHDGLLTTFMNMNTKYAKVTTLGHTMEHVTSLLKKLGEDALASEAPALAPRELTAPGSGEEFLAWYGDRPTNPQVPIQGDQLMTEEGGAGYSSVSTVPSSSLGTVFLASNNCQNTRCGHSWSWRGQT